MSPEPDPQATTWQELAWQDWLVHMTGGVTCGSTTHVDRFGACPYCRAAV